MTKSIISIVSIIILLTLFTISVSADETVITIVMPNYTTETPTEPPSPTAAPVKTLPINIYPLSVTETVKSGRREIVKTYELSPNEKPSDIPRDNFERDGYLYELSDITKKDNVRTEQKNHSETVKVDTATNDFDSILKLLPTTKEYDNGGFTGTLTLDVSGITVEQAGTKNVAYTINETREYPYLSSNDSSYVPKTITNSYGRTLTLSGVTWRTQSSVAVDYDEIPDSYTAVATYSGTSYKTVVTGYTVTAQYYGTIGKTVTGKTIYTATFIGTQIISPTIEPPTTLEIVPETTLVPTEIEETTETSTETTSTTTEPTTEIPALSEEIETSTEVVTTTEVSPPNEWNHMIYIVIIIILAAGLVGSYFYYKRKITGGHELK